MSHLRLPSRLAYLITREVEALRGSGARRPHVWDSAAGARSLLTSGRPGASPVRRSPSSRSIAPGWRGLASARSSLHPVRYFATLRRALKLSSGGARATLWHVFYFAEAILLCDELNGTGDIGHVHAHFANVASAVAMLMAIYGGAEGMSWSFTMHGPTRVRRRGPLVGVHPEGPLGGVRRLHKRFLPGYADKLVEREHWSKLHVVRCGLDVEGPRLAADRAARRRPPGRCRCSAFAG